MADRGEGAKKKRKPKSKASKDNDKGKKEGPRNDVNSAKEEKSESPQAAEERFERELVWCVQQLELSLSSSQIKPDSRQGQDAIKALKVLQSQKAPLIKKRQVMRNTFGDYRKKMDEEEKKYAASAKKMCLTSVDSDKQTKSTFFRKSSQLTDTNTASVLENEDTVKSATSQENTRTDCFMFNKPSGRDFKFNFGASSEHESQSNCNDDTPKSTDEDGIQNAVNETAVNFYKMQVSDGDFQFKFSNPDS